MTLVLAAAVEVHATDDWAQHNRFAQLNDTVSVSPVAVFIGNSITDGWDDCHPTFFTANNFINRGIGGQVSSQMLVRFQADVIQLKPQAVVILAGTNDIGLNNGYIELQHIAENIYSMCEIARYHHIRPIICSVLPVYEYPWRKEIKNPTLEIQKLNTLLRNYALQNGITYVDYYTAMADERGGLPWEYSTDGVHPTSAGYDVMEQLIVKALAND